MTMWIVELPCMLVLVLHARVFVRCLENLERRAGRLRAKRARVLTQYRKAPLGFSIFALFVMAMMLYAFLSSNSGTLRPLPLSGSVSLVWFLGLVLVGKTRLAIRMEIKNPEGAYVVSRVGLPTA